MPWAWAGLGKAPADAHKLLRYRIVLHSVRPDGMQGMLHLPCKGFRLHLTFPNDRTDEYYVPC